MIKTEAKTAKEEGIECTESLKKTRALALKAGSDEKLQTRSFIIQLNKKCRVLDENFGELDSHTKSGHELIAHSCMFDTNFGDYIKWPVVYLYWCVQVDKTYNPMKSPDRKIQVDLLSKKMSRLSVAAKSRAAAAGKATKQGKD